MTQKATPKTNKPTEAQTKIKVTLSQEITHAGKTVAKGKAIEVDKVTADWLIELNLAK